MGQITDYASLQTELANLIVRTDMTAELPLFVQLAESQMRRRFQTADLLPSMTRTTYLLTTDVEFLALPADYAGDETMEVYDPDLERWIPLDPVDPNSHAILLSDRNGVNALPLTYCLLDNRFVFSPIPDAAYQVRLTYKAILPALSVSNTTNWVLTNYPDAYLYGAALQSAPQLVEDDRAGTWGQLFTTAVNDIIAAEKAKIGSRMTPNYRADIPLPRRWGFNITTGR